MRLRNRLFMLCDLETRSRVDLPTAGARRYAADPSTQITTAVWDFRGTVKTACTVHPQLGSNPITELYADIHELQKNDGVFVAHHVGFDASVLTGPNQNPFLVFQPDNLSCTMARAQSLALPGGLDELCMALNVRGKDPRGKALVKATCWPQRDGTFNEDYATYRELLEYNLQDVNCLRSVDELLPELTAEEQKIFARTWRKNNVGLPIDVELAQAIALRRQAIESEAERELREITNNVVTRVTQRQRVVQWGQGWIPSTKKHEVAETLDNPDLPWQVRSVLEIVQESGGSAPTKAQSLLNRHVNGFYKDGTRYFGARSGRGTSEGFNAFNIARPSGRYDGKDGRPSTDYLIAALKAGFQLDNVSLTDALRGCIIAPPGYVIIDTDEEQAELRLALWQSGDVDRLNILKSGADLYMYNAIRILGLPETATKSTHPKERQDFKSVTLGGNYQLGWKTYHAQMRRTGNRISEQKAIDDITGYREQNPKLVTLWDALKTAFWNCLYDPPGRYYEAGKVRFIKDGTTIWLILPSGRALPHYSACVDENGNMGFYRARFGAMRFQKAFGGSLLEITCQGMTRDLITAAEEDIENELPDVVLGLDVYDSIIAFAPEHVARERAAQIKAIMERPRFWTEGLPLAASGYVAKRLMK
jgi:DNA polymerase